MTDIADKTMWVTGASSGIGRAIAEKASALGARVILSGRRQEALESVQSSLSGESLIVPFEATDYEHLSSVVDLVWASGPVDILINNAGVIEPISHLATSDPDGWGHAIDINLKGVYNGMRAVMPMMIDAGGGTIITVSSGAAHNPIEAWSHYCASKAGAAMLTACADKEARDKGLRAMGLSPGTVATQMQREIKESGINPVSQLDWSDHIPADWPAKALAWMCSADADTWIGQEISLRDEAIRKRVGLI